MGNPIQLSFAKFDNPIWPYYPPLWDLKLEHPLFFYYYFFRTFTSVEELFAEYSSGKVHPGDLKPALAKSLNKILQVLFLFYIPI